MNKHVDAALLERLKLHQEWLASFGQAGRQLWLEDADLTGLDLSDRDLSEAHLAGASSIVPVFAGQICIALTSLLLRYAVSI